MNGHQITMDSQQSPSSSQSVSSPASGSLDLFSMLWSPYQIIQQAVLPYYHKSVHSMTLNDLNDYCLMSIFHYLELDDLIHLRQVCRRLMTVVEDYFKLKKRLVFDCQMNGVQLHHGQYQFNIVAFEFLLQHMPNVQILNFERCPMMRSALATCPYNLFDTITLHLTDLKELHIGRTSSMKQHSIEQLARTFPQLTHLTITLYNEHLLSSIIQSFKHLQYLNLDQSVLYDYGSILRNLPPSIRVLILPSDLKNEKMKVLKFLCDGNGINLERLEVSITANDIHQDQQYFHSMGQMMSKLKWFQCEISCSSMMNPYKTAMASSMSSNSEINNNSLGSLRNGHLDSDDLNHFNNNNLDENGLAIINTDHHLISGLHRLTNLRVLILKEKDYFDPIPGNGILSSSGSDDFFCTSTSSLFDDCSLLKIFKHCGRLVMLSISCSLCCNRMDYARYMNRKQDDHVINRILNEEFAMNNRIENSSHHNNDENHSDEKNQHFSTDNCDSSMFNDDVTCQNCNKPDKLQFQLSTSGPTENCLDSGINDDHQQHHQHQQTSALTITDHSLSTFDLYLPGLRILQLRGVRLGQPTFESIANLPRLEFLRLDSVQFNYSQQNPDHSSLKDSFSELMKQLTSGQSDNETKRKTVIHLTNIPLI